MNLIRLIFGLVIWIFAGHGSIAWSQKKETLDRAYNVSVGLRKTFDIGKKNKLDLRQQFQFNPKIQKAAYRVGDIFNEEGFWPIPDRATTNDDDDDDQDNEGGNGNGNPIREIDDNPLTISLSSRSVTSILHTFSGFRWLRISNGYSMFYGEKEFRHTIRSEADYRPVRHWKKKPKFEIALRGQMQHLGRNRKKGFQWTRTVAPGADLIWTFKKEHQLTLSHSYNGVWEKDFFEFDRWRLGLNAGFSYKKIHRFSVGFQYQERMNSKKKKPILGFGLGHEIRL